MSRRRATMIVTNTFAQIERFIKELGKGCGTRFECECYDIGHLYTLAHFLDRKMLRAAAVRADASSASWAASAPHPEDLMHMRRTADRLFGKDYQWSILAAGRHQINLATIGATMGGNVRVGLEDSIYLGPGRWRRAMPSRCTKIRKHPGGTVAGDRHACRSPADAEAQGRRPGGLLISE